MTATTGTRTTVTSVLLISVLATLLLPPRVLLVQAISLEKLCETRCFYGRGGNLCNCNAFHFAGKRSGRGGLAAAGTAGSVDESDDVDDLAPLAGLALSKDRDTSASGFRGAGARAGGDDDRLVVEGFFGVEGREKSTVRKLAALLKAAIDERLIDSRRMSRKWLDRPSSFGSNGAVY